MENEISPYIVGPVLFLRGKMSEENRFCARCGAPAPGRLAVLSKVRCFGRAPGVSCFEHSADGLVEMRKKNAARQSRPAGARSRIGALILATILIVAGLGIFFPQLPWQAFWGSLLILLGVWIVGLWFLRGRGSLLRSSAK